MQKDEEIKISSALSFYMLVNESKYFLKAPNYSIADQIYGSMILAIAINSQYNKVNNIGETIRVILLGIISKFKKSELEETLSKIKMKDQLTSELAKYHGVTIANNQIGSFALDCENIELLLNYFFNYIIAEDDLSIDKLFDMAKQFGIIARLGDDDEKNKEIFRFYYLNKVLRTKIRTGWDKNHWNINNERIERISEHIVGTIALAIAIASEFSYKIDLNKVCEVLCIHEIGEIEIGDISPFDGINQEDKLTMEHKAMRNILGNLSNKEILYKALLAFDEHLELDYQFARYCDKLEADIQSRIYQDMGCHHDLTEQENNIAFQSDKVKKILQGDVSSAFDVWYEMDKGIYEEEEIFKKILTYIKNTKIKQ